MKGVSETDKRVREMPHLAIQTFLVQWPHLSSWQ
ncbi:hypothetical protein T11_3986 [Trichinella zimbabwensis]|uniref:Uncharacterized protein n=1 Tax=Trichinella zimbabwensis TaxID=268475 RepID=A0A0V1GBQ2_9BILA|nr:hypothetical protein T11_3986 [Trichinella zimbabwensis]